MKAKLTYGCHELTIGNATIETHRDTLLNDQLIKVEGFVLKHRSLLTESVMVPEIKRVIFNKPATVVFWKDGTKTVVKCQGNDEYDKEKGLALCIVKKMMGNKGNFNNLFKKWITEKEDDGLSCHIAKIENAFNKEDK